MTTNNFDDYSHFGTFSKTILSEDCEAKVNQFDDHVVLELSGSLNGTNVKKIWDIARKAFSYPNMLDAPYRYPIFDLRDLEYVSPAGLRMLAELNKQYGNLTLAYVCKRVYDVMDTCGFTKFVNVIRGAYNINDIDSLPAALATGSSAKIIQLDNERVLKLFESNYADFRIQQPAIYEYKNAKNSFILGVPSAIPLELVKREDRLGIVYEKLESNYFDYIFEEKSKIKERAVELAKFSREATRIIVDPEKIDLPDHRDVYYDIERNCATTFDFQDIIGPKDLENIKKIIFSIPPTHTYLHGDVFMNNVMFDSWGQKRFIDFAYSGYGHPIWELIDSFIMFSECRQAHDIEALNSAEYKSVPLNSEERREVWLAYLKEFAGVEDPETVNEIDRIVGAMIDCVNIMTYSRFRFIFEEEEGKQFVRDKYAYTKPFIDQFIEEGFRPMPFN